MRRRALIIWTGLALAACDEGVGSEGTTLPEPLGNLSGGLVFATGVLPGGSDYDLYWAPAVAGLPQPFLQLTDTAGNEVQPSVSARGNALVFARQEDGIFYVNADGEVSRISDVRNSPLRDSLPAVSPDGDRVAWVREDTSRTVSDLFVATEVWVANFDGTDARAVSPDPVIIQDAPVFEPIDGTTRLAWSEFNASTVGPAGPTAYAVRVYDLAAATGAKVCEGAYEDPEAGTVRCFGQHLSWPEPDRLILGQQLLEIDPRLGPIGSGLPNLLNGLAGGIVVPERSPHPLGFFPAFPVSASFAGGRMVVDGVVSPLDGNTATLAFFVARSDASNVERVDVDGLSADLDLAGTASFLFSLATPQLMP
ncbi:MAG: hypothetical protein AAFU79_16940 [Myxococcota bacterium]